MPCKKTCVVTPLLGAMGPLKMWLAPFPAETMDRVGALRTRVTKNLRNWHPRKCFGTPPHTKPA